MNAEHANPAYKLLLLAIAGVLALGTNFYHFVERLDGVDTYYFSVVTLAAVGYGDIVPKTGAGKIFTTFYIFIGVGILTTFISYTLKRCAQKRTANKN